MRRGDLFAREHDLPPRWDGRVVFWTEWTDQLAGVFLCPPPRARTVCPACGSVEQCVTARGMVALRRRTTLADIVNYDRAAKAGQVALWRLHAYRCTECLHDQVWDSDRDELWDLDFTDYSDAGSDHPTGRW